jgi:hypothetical protein
MRKTLTLTALLLAVGISMPAFAEEGADCTSQPRSKWISTDAAKTKAKEQGYEVRRVKSEGSCYELYGFDKNKARVQIFMDPSTGKIMKGMSE